MKVKIKETRELIIELTADHYDEEHRTPEGMLAQEKKHLEEGLYDEFGTWENDGTKRTVTIEQID